jgi:nucleoside-diphosphate-sugar epimerase
VRVLVAGCGYVGSVLAASLAAEGHEAFGLRRRPEGLPPGVRPVAVDLGDREALAAALPPDLDGVVYATAADSREPAAYRRAYVEGLENLLALLPRPGPRVIFTSSTSVYGQDDGSWVDETSPTEPPSETGRILLEAEAVLATSRRPGASLRLGGIYGPGRTRLLESVRRGEARIPAEPGVFTNRIHRDDAARALDHLLKLPQLGPVYLGVDDEPAELGTVLRWMAGRLGVPEPPVAAAGEGTRAGRGLRTRKRCSNRRLRGSGFDLRHPTFREGYDAILRGEEGASGGD